MTCLSIKVLGYDSQEAKTFVKIEFAVIMTQYNVLVYF